jgi:hypothetical protein
MTSSEGTARNSIHRTRQGGTVNKNTKRNQWKTASFSYSTIFFNCCSGGVESIWVHSALWPPIGLLCQPRVIMMMEKLVEWLAGETQVLGGNLPQCCFVHHKNHMPARTQTWAAAVGSQRLTAWATARPTPPLISTDIFVCDSSLLLLYGIKIIFLSLPL